jgi:hypothetical protein
MPRTAGPCQRWAKWCGKKALREVVQGIDLPVQGMAVFVSGSGDSWFEPMRGNDLAHRCAMCCANDTCWRNPTTNEARLSRTRRVTCAMRVRDILLCPAARDAHASRARDVYSTRPTCTSHARHAYAMYAALGRIVLCHWLTYSHTYAGA